MSRKRSGFAITSVRGGSGAGGGNGNASNGSGSGAASPVTSRFRLVRLTAEPLRRGRWVCRDYYERDSGCRAGRGCGRLPASLDSPQAPLPGSASASGSPPAAPPHQPRSLGAFAQLVQALPPGHAPLPRPALALAGEENEEEEEEEEGAGSGLTAIDNKIEQAMELVKAHLLLAVREELELLRERLQELRARRAGLERENLLLRSLCRPPDPP